jgi:glycosyltransferase involved in cell wall biosynthesis
MMLTMIHANGARIVNGMFRVDRKFHSGMLAYAQSIHAPLTTVHPENLSSTEAIDTIEAPLEGLPYGVMVLKTDSASRLLEDHRALLEVQIAESDLVYGMGMGFAELARRHNVPYIMVEEYDLQTRIAVASTQVSSKPRKLIRAARAAWSYRKELLPDARHAFAIHCNGYPIYDALKTANDSRLLYLDSRMHAEMVISESALKARLAGNAATPLRLIYSGRYERLKGSVDAVKVAVAALHRGMNVELHCYGAGSQADQMRSVAATAAVAGRIVIHDAVTYPELVVVSRDFDAFICCHVQGDPSCTYLESFGSGLPIVGYGNRMWRRLSEESAAGFWSPIGDVNAVVDSLARLTGDRTLLANMSRKARAFAAAHTFEREFALRTDALNQVLSMRAKAAVSRGLPDETFR